MLPASLGFLKWNTTIEYLTYFGQYDGRSQSQKRGAHLLFLGWMLVAVVRRPSRLIDDEAAVFRYRWE